MAYTARHSQEMELLRSRNQSTLESSSHGLFSSNLKLLRHYIGRLGHQIKAVKDLVQCALRLRHLLDDFEVRGVECPARSPPPPIDGKTNLASILVRMLREKDERLRQFQEILLELDSKFKVQERLTEIYKDPNFKPRVHAEVQVLDTFHHLRLAFEDSDPFIGCSKPACYCCSLYFRHHPQGPVAPSSHQTIHKNWRPPDFMPDQTRQRDILNKMVQDIREEVFKQLELKQPRYPWHPDSVTGITGTDAYSGILDQLEDSSRSSVSSEDLGTPENTPDAS